VKGISFVFFSLSLRFVGRFGCFGRFDCFDRVGPLSVFDGVYVYLPYVYGAA